jgi:prevent-host-death family protein
MQTMGAFQAKTYFSSLLEQVEKGEQIIITKHGRPVARLVPTTGINQEKIKAVIQRFKKMAQSHTLGGLDWKQLRDEGRK